MHHDVKLLREVISKLVPMIASRGIRVTQMGTQAYVKTDTRTHQIICVNIPYLPDDADEALVRATQGFIDHECGHVLDTDFTITSVHRKNAAAIAKARGLTDPGVNEEIFKRIHSIWNMVEDPFVERCMRKRFPGAIWNLEQLFDTFINRITKPALAKAKTPAERMNYFMVPIIRSWAGQERFKRFLDEEKAWDEPLVKAFCEFVPDHIKKACAKNTTTKQNAATALELFQILHPPAPPPPSEKSEENGKDKSSGAPDKGESEPSKDKSSKKSESDGEGSNKDKPEDKDDKGSAGEEKSEEKPEGDEADDKKDEGSADGEEAGDDKPGADDPKDEGEEAEEDDGEGAGEDKSEEEESADDKGDDESDGKDEKPDGDKPEGEEDGSSDEGDDGEVGGSSDEPGSDETSGSGGEKDEGAEPPEGKAIIEEGARDPGHEHKPSPFEAVVLDLSDKDISAAIAQAISLDAARLTRDADYRIFTRDYDVIEPFPIDRFEDSFLEKMDEKTRHMIGPMQKEIERMMAAQSRVVNNPGQRSGRLNPSALHRLRLSDDRVFRRREEFRSKATAVSLLIDNSGSMGGWHSKLGTAMTAGYALSQTLERVKIPHEVLGFTTYVAGRLKDNSPVHYGRRRRRVVSSGSNPAVKEDLRIDDEYDEALRKEMERSGIHFTRIERIYMPIFKGFDERFAVSETRKRFACGAQGWQCANNIDGESVRYATERLLRRPEPRKVLIVLSDGNPACTTSDPKEVYADLHRAVEQAEKAKVETIGIGIMSNAVSAFYPKSMVLYDVEDLPKTVMGELKRVLMK